MEGGGLYTNKQRHEYKPPLCNKSVSECTGKTGGEERKTEIWRGRERERGIERERKSERERDV